MSDHEYQNRDFLVLDVANQSIITDPVAPEAALLSAQRFSALARIMGGRHTLPQKRDNGFLSLSIQLLDLLFGSAADLDCPALIG